MEMFTTLRGGSDALRSSPTPSPALSPVITSHHQALTCTLPPPFRLFWSTSQASYTWAINISGFPPIRNLKKSNSHNTIVTGKERNNNSFVSSHFPGCLSSFFSLFDLSTDKGHTLRLVDRPLTSVIHKISSVSSFMCLLFGSFIYQRRSFVL